MKELLLMWVEPAYWRTALVLAAVGLVALGYVAGYVVGYGGTRVIRWALRRVRR